MERLNFDSKKKKKWHSNFIDANLGYYEPVF